MPTEQASHTLHTDTLQGLMRDLHVAVLEMAQGPHTEAASARYVNTMALLWSAATGLEMTVYEAYNILLKEPTKKELRDARRT